MLKESFAAFHLAEVVEKQIKARFAERLFGTTDYLREVPTRNEGRNYSDAVSSAEWGFISCWSNRIIKFLRCSHDLCASCIVNVVKAAQSARDRGS